MEVGHLYELDFPYEAGRGSKKRPVLIIVVSNEYDQVLGLKVTRFGIDQHKFRIPIKNSPQSNLSDQSYVQYDRYAFFENAPKRSRGELSEQDFIDIVKVFTEHHGI